MKNESKIVEKNVGNPFEIQIEKGKTPDENGNGKQNFCSKCKKLFSYIFIDGLSGMAIGLFATLIIGTIIDTIGDIIISWGAGFGKYFIFAGQVAQFLMGAGIALGMGYKLNKSPLVTISAGVVGFLASFSSQFLADANLNLLAYNPTLEIYKTSVGEPLTAFIASFVALEMGTLVSGKTKVDIIITPLVSIFSGALIAFLIANPLADFMSLLRSLVKTAGEQQPFLMGILVAVLMGVFLTLPISSAAIGVMLSLDGIVAGAAVVGCCCHMVGYAVMSFRENKWGGLIAQGLGTSMLQMPNLVKKPILWLPPIIASAILGPIASCVLGMISSPVGSGMGTAGLVGVLETFTAMTSAGINGWIVLLQIVCIDILAPALLCLFISEIMRKFNLIKYGDLKLNL